MVNMSRPSDKVAIVTGASKGIGRGIATAAIGSRDEFPYYGSPHGAAEHSGLEPISTGFYE
jgi:NAD(P)-dependent dehydrogenase (short-subunit alcohol dehydrogenase family)